MPPPYEARASGKVSAKPSPKSFLCPGLFPGRCSFDVLLRQHCDVRRLSFLTFAAKVTFLVSENVNAVSSPTRESAFSAYSRKKTRRCTRRVRAASNRKPMVFAVSQCSVKHQVALRFARESILSLKSLPKSRRKDRKEERLNDFVDLKNPQLDFSLSRAYEFKAVSQTAKTKLVRADDSHGRIHIPTIFRNISALSKKGSRGPLEIVDPSDRALTEVSPTFR